MIADGSRLFVVMCRAVLMHVCHMFMHSAILMFMHHRMHHFHLPILGLILITAAAALPNDPVVESRWASTPVVIDGKARMLSFSERRTDGVVKGTVVDLEKLHNGVHEVVNDLERVAQRGIEEVYLTITGPAVAGERVKGFVAVPAHDGKVTTKDFNEAVTLMQELAVYPTEWKCEKWWYTLTLTHAYTHAYTHTRH